MTVIDKSENFVVNSEPFIRLCAFHVGKPSELKNLCENKAGCIFRLPRFMQILFFMHFVKLCRALNSYMGFSSG